MIEFDTLRGFVAEYVRQHIIEQAESYSDMQTLGLKG